MNTRLTHFFVGSLLLASPTLLMGADGNGCGGEVIVGSDECKVGGCSGTICGEPDDDFAGTCEYFDHYACYGEVGICERGADGACGWRQTEELTTCIEENQPNPVESLLETCLAFCARASQCDGFMGCDQSCRSAVELVIETGCEDEYFASSECFENVADLCDLDQYNVCRYTKQAELGDCIENAGGQATDESGG
jgi:hypothetical protein